MPDDRLSPHFTRAEFACRCGCGFATVDQELIAGLELLRAAVGRPVHILSGCRCPAHNKAVGGAKNSRHVQGKAADVRVDGLTARQLYEVARGIVQFRGFGVDDERGFVHLDVRAVGTRWCYRAGKEAPWHD